MLSLAITKASSSKSNNCTVLLLMACATHSPMPLILTRFPSNLWARAAGHHRGTAQDSGQVAQATGNNEAIFAPTVFHQSCKSSASESKSPSIYHVSTTH